MKNILKTAIFAFSISILMTNCGSGSDEPIEIGDNQTEATATVSDAIEVTPAQFELAKMAVGKLEDKTFPTVIRATGQIEIPSKNKTKVSAYAGGYVSNINLVEGQSVNKGQVLFTLENPDFVQMQQDYLEAKEQLTYLKSDYERQKTLADENVSARKNFLKAESDYRVTMTKMEGMKKRLSMLRINTDNISAQNLVSSISIFAPESGYVTTVLAQKGMFLNPTDVAVELMNTNDVQIILNVFEKDILKVKNGQPITFKIPDASTETYQAKVNRIGKTVDENKRIVKVYGQLTNGKDKAVLVAGMYLDAGITLQNNPAKGLPETAIIGADEQSFVLIQTSKKGENYTFEKRAIKVGERKDGFVEVLNSSDFEGKMILLNGGFNLIGIE
jgi:cobalt-zinc-cadmium efflux system membrane fusion protein